MTWLRGRRWSSLVVVGCGFVVGTLSSVPAFAEWHRLDSPNFVLVGDVSPRTLRDIAVRFEGFRETLGRVLNEAVTRTAVPTVVVVFPSDRAFHPYKLQYEGKAVEMSGVFIGRADVNYIALVADRHDEALRIVFHEYAHLIIANAGRNVPAWLNEGLAEYYSTYEVSQGGKQALLGRPVESHLLLLNQASLLPLDELLQVDHASPLYNEGNRRSVFYAQSWALTHMLLHGRPPRVGQLGQYLVKVGQGIPAADAWHEIFGTMPIHTEVQRYVRQSIFQATAFKFSEGLARFEATPSKLPPADADAFLADFLIAQDRGAEAAARLASGANAAAATPWSTTVAALLDLSKGGRDNARKRLLALGEGIDWLTAYRAGVAVTALREGQDRPDEEELIAARRLLGAALSGREIPHAAARLSEFELDAAATPPAHARAAIERARLMAPGRIDYIFLHGRVLASQGDFPAARNVLAPLMSPAYPPAVRDHARSLIGYIVTVERAAASPASPSSSPGVSPGGAEPAPASGAPAPAEVFRPSYRPLQDGEQRLEGVLERIECGRRGALLHVLSADGPVQVQAQMEKVDFITYRDDLTGSVTCGPLKEPMRVFVAWRAGDGAGERIAVAVEFLPR